MGITASPETQPETRQSIRAPRRTRIISIIAAIVLGLIFLLAGVGKALDTVESLKMLFNPFPSFIPATLTQAMFKWLPYLEIVIGGLLISGIALGPAAGVSLVLIAGFIMNNGWMLSLGLGYEPCDCFGVVDKLLKLEFSTRTSFRLDLAMLVLAVMALYFGRGRLSSPQPWWLRGRRDEG